MGPHFQRAVLLYDQGRYPLAEQELRLELASDPQNAEAHALLSLALAEQERLADATAEAQAAIGLLPDHPMGHYALGLAMLRRNRFEEAAAAAGEAVRLDPEDPDHHALSANVALARRNWPAALEAAERGLHFDAEHVACNNLRATALVQLGRREEAGATLEAALARDPEDAWSHANRGWTLLERGDPKKSMEHFREALRLEPGMEWARAGIVEALKARNVVYGLMLRWFLWMGKLSGRAQWAIVILGFLGYRAVLKLHADNPAFRPFLLPLIVAYIAFAVMTWISVPLFNLLLRLNRFGRLALSPDQVSGSNALGLCLGGALAALAVRGLGGPDDCLFAAAFLGLLAIPVSSVFHCSRGWPRTLMSAYAAVLVLLGLAVFALSWAETFAERKEPLWKAMESLIYAFMMGVFLAQWVAVALVSVRPRR
jgi:tetratricopeptide (TPR) repeat protein